MRPITKESVETSIIIPCYNEERTIPLLLDAILAQDYPTNRLEVIIADAMSEDGTRKAIYRFASDHPNLKLRVVDNPKRTIPAGINAAARVAEGEYLLRLDAHSVPNVRYISTSISVLKDRIAENVGGIWQIQPAENTCIAKAIAAAAAHPLGAGDALYRISQKATYVDTVPFGAFSKQSFDKLGGFNEKLLSNEDYEFNTRLRLSGGRIWLDPRIRSRYYARRNLKELSKQYWRYGFWKFRMLKKYPQTLRWRQAIPPLFVLSFILLGFFSFFFEIARIILATGWIIYLAFLGFFSLVETIKRKNICYLLMTFALIVIHFSWGSGFLTSGWTKSREV